MSLQIEKDSVICTVESIKEMDRADFAALHWLQYNIFLLCFWSTLQFGQWCQIDDSSSQQWLAFKQQEVSSCY